jgi:hypothetical protein
MVAQIKTYDSYPNILKYKHKPTLERIPTPKENTAQNVWHHLLSVKVES